MSDKSEWWASYFDSLYLTEHGHLFDPELERQFVARLLKMLELPVGSQILDCPCGQGRHARLLAEAGFRVTGADLSADLLKRAKAASPFKGLRYVRADMRKLPSRWTATYDVVLNLFSSFGFFLHPQDDATVVGEFARVLRPGGVLVWHGANRDVVAARFPPRDWWTAEDGTVVTQEREFDTLSGVLTVHTRWMKGKREAQRSYRMRLYTATRLAEICLDAGLIVELAADGDKDRRLSRRSSSMILVARKLG